MEKEKKKGLFSRLVSGLTKTRNNVVSGIDSIFSGFSSILVDSQVLMMIFMMKSKRYL